MNLFLQILIPPKGLIIKLKKEAENPKEVLDQVTKDCYYFLYNLILTFQVLKNVCPR